MCAHIIEVRPRPQIVGHVIASVRARARYYLLLRVCSIIITMAIGDSTTEDWIFFRVCVDALLNAVKFQLELFFVSFGSRVHPYSGFAERSKASLIFQYF